MIIHLGPKNDWYYIDIITWNNIIISNRLEYLKPHNCVQTICIICELFMQNL